MNLNFLSGKSICSSGEIRRMKSKVTLVFCLLALSLQSLCPTLVQARDLPQNLRPDFPTASSSPSPFPSASPIDLQQEDDSDEDSAVVLTLPQQKAVVTCFREEKACEINLSQCNANMVATTQSLMDKFLIGLGGVLVGMIIRSNLR